MFEQERRKHVRIHFERQVQLDLFTEVYGKCHIRDISLGGMFVNGEFPHLVEDQCYVNIPPTGKKSNLPLEPLAKIVRQDDEGVALKFTSMSFESLLSLEMILLYQASAEISDSEMKLPEDLPFEICDELSCFPEKYNPFLEQA